MPKCLAVPTKVLEEMPLWQTLNRVEGVISAAVILSSPEIQEILEVIKNNGVFLERKGPEGIEDNPEWQQIILYGVVFQKNKFFLYQRGKTTAYKEERLRAKFAVGVGGHIDPSDSASDLIFSLRREIEEEIRLSKNGAEIPVDGNFPAIKIIGLIKDEKDEVGKVHLGLVCLIELFDLEVEVATKNKENIWGQMVNLEEYRKITSIPQYVPEGWTKLVVENFLLTTF
ncbi:MAG: hypothetical protein PHW31_04340 [Candidatus Pacebacteria bacterium]|nr:hypothetical protein [Candidatus Paceibacterota bacterium]